MIQTKNIKFNCQELNIDSVYIFDDGDFIVFENYMPMKEDINTYYYSKLYDAKTLQPKLYLKVSSESCFFDLKDGEFGICKNYNNFNLYKFNSKKTDYKFVQSLNAGFETGKKLKKLSNGDIIFFKVSLFSSITIFRKIKDNNNNENKYEVCNEHHLEYYEDLIELNDKEFLGYQKFISTPESILFRIFNNNNYQITKENKIICQDKNNNYKKRLYFTSLFKYKDKLICSGGDKIYIIELNYLELETTIQLSKAINKMLVRPNGNILVLSQQNSINKILYFIYNIKIDYKTNEMIQNKENDITEKIGNLPSFFQFYNYPNNGLVFITNNSLIIYDNYCD